MATSLTGSVVRGGIQVQVSIDAPDPEVDARGLADRALRLICILSEIEERAGVAKPPDAKPLQGDESVSIDPRIPLLGDGGATDGARGASDTENGDKADDTDGRRCADCGRWNSSEQVIRFSNTHFGLTLCVPCQEKRRTAAPVSGSGETF